MQANVLKLLFLGILTFLAHSIDAQVKVGNNPTSITASAILDVESTSKGVIFPRIALTGPADQTTISSPATGLLVYNTGSGGLIPSGYYYWNGTEWKVFANQSAASSNSSLLNVGESRVWVGTMDVSAANGTVLSSLYPNQLPVVDGWRADVAKESNTYYRPRIYNESSPTQVMSYQTFATQVNENKTKLNVSIPFGSFEGVDNNDIVLWTTDAAEVETTNMQVQVSPGIWRWYEFQWWAMETPLSGKKTIFLSVRRKG
jgi:hypothetical protein